MKRVVIRKKSCNFAVKTNTIFIIDNVNTLKRFLPDVLVVLLFAAISFAYFYPADIEGRILYRHDSSASRGLGEEAGEYHKQTGDVTRWCSALYISFSSMDFLTNHSGINVWASKTKLSYADTKIRHGVLLFILMRFAS